MAPIEQQHPSLRTLVVDNYDSYTFNLLSLWPDNSPATARVLVVRNDQLTWEQLERDVLPHIDNVIISPGPGRPERKEDFGVCAQLLAQTKIPVFGVCLGHQGLAIAFGGKVVHAPEVMHGRLSAIQHTNQGVFSEIPQHFRAVRYHSLVVDEQSLPKSLRVTAWVDAPNSEHVDGPRGRRVVMGLEHEDGMFHGVQFHPESICTEFGKQIFENFQRISTEKLIEKGMLFPRPRLPDNVASLSVLRHSIPTHLADTTSGSHPLILRGTRLDSVPVSLEDIFEELLGNESVKFWLDSASRIRDDDDDKLALEQSRFSFIGTGEGKRSFTVRYWTAERKVQLSRFLQGGRCEIASWSLPSGNSFWDWLKAFTDRCFGRLETSNISNCPLPFEFFGGLVGYFGYEMRRESLPGYHYQLSPEDLNSSKLPDAVFTFADRVIAHDRVTNSVWLLCLVCPGYTEGDISCRAATEPEALADTVGISEGDAERWISRTSNEIRNLAAQLPTANGHSIVAQTNASTNGIKKMTKKSAYSPAYAAKDRPDYLAAILNSKRQILEGETYEVCLTTQIRIRPPSPFHSFKLYKKIRARNPAPFGAYLHFADTNQAICGSSPERFLRVFTRKKTEGNKMKNAAVVERWVEMKPIKGTVARVAPPGSITGTKSWNVNGKGISQENSDWRLQDAKAAEELRTSVKERAENLMIVDLIRNDLAQVCSPASLHVPRLMEIESYATVHQLVSTIRGKLRDDIGAVEAVKKCFPPGSMTGAPKLRTVQLLDELEDHKPRGVYSGVLGYFSANGTADFNVVIRTCVVDTDGTVSIGAGGAITALSNPEDEYDEVLLKASSVLPCVIEAFDELAHTSVS